MPPIPVEDSTTEIAAFEKALMGGVKKRQALSQAMDNALTVKGKSPAVANGRAKRVRG
jgi:hypothetical protein